MPQVGLAVSVARGQPLALGLNATLLTPEPPGSAKAMLSVPGQVPDVGDPVALRRSERPAAGAECHGGDRGASRDRQGAGAAIARVPQVHLTVAAAHGERQPSRAQRHGVRVHGPRGHGRRHSPRPGGSVHTRTVPSVPLTASFLLFALNATAATLAFWSGSTAISRWGYLPQVCAGVVGTTGGGQHRPVGAERLRPAAGAEFPDLSPGGRIPQIGDSAAWAPSSGRSSGRRLLLRPASCRPG